MISKKLTLIKNEFNRGEEISGEVHLTITYTVGIPSIGGNVIRKFAKISLEISSENENLIDLKTEFLFDYKIMSEKLENCSQKELGKEVGEKALSEVLDTVNFILIKAGLEELKESQINVK